MKRTPTRGSVCLTNQCPRPQPRTFGVHHQTPQDAQLAIQPARIAHEAAGGAAVPQNEFERGVGEDQNAERLAVGRFLEQKHLVHEAEAVAVAVVHRTELAIVGDGAVGDGRPALERDGPVAHDRVGDDDLRAAEADELIGLQIVDDVLVGRGDDEGEVVRASRASAGCRPWPGRRGGAKSR